MENDKLKFKRDFKKRLYDVTLKLLKMTDSFPKNNVARRLGDQLIRSGTSVIANYVEGLSASTRREFTNYMTISLKSTNESKLWLCLLRDSKTGTPKY